MYAKRYYRIVFEDGFVFDTKANHTKPQLEGFVKLFSEIIAAYPIEDVEVRGGNYNIKDVT